jgi:hypothetical protein
MMKIYSALRPLAGGVQEINIAKRQAERTYQSSGERLKAIARRSATYTSTGIAFFYMRKRSYDCENSPMHCFLFSLVLFFPGIKDSS